MAVRLLMFASAREAAGAASAEYEADTLGSLLAAAVDAYGPRFAEVLARSKVWVNGEEAGPEAALKPGDEVAVLPPVSGGS
jgi:molybdopterin synthase sulfur carrier subunit